MILRILTPLLLLVCFTASMAQTAYTTVKTTKARNVKTYDQAMQLIDLGQLDQAFQLLSQTVKSDSLFADAYIQMAGIRHDQGFLEEADKWFNHALRIAPDYRKSVWLQSGLTKWRLDKYDEAETHLKKFLALDPANEREISLAQTYIRRSEFAAEAMRNPVPFVARTLGPEINTPGDEYLPSFTADGSALIFTRVVDNQEDFYISRQTPDGGWGPAEPIDQINTDNNEGAQTVSADGRLLIFTACNRPGGLGRCDLYMSEYVDGKWTQVVNMGEPVNSGAWESQPSLSADGKALYFASDRSGGKGGKDIWVSLRQADGRWGAPQNLGDTINTPREEQGPFIHPDGQTLYFMSDGHPGMGGADIFYSRLNDHGAWGTPINIGYPINSKSDEGLLVVSLDGKTAYFASNRQGLQPTLNERGQPSYDLYEFDLYPEARPAPVTYVKAVVRDAITSAPLQAEVEFSDLFDGKIFSSATTDKNGQFLVVLPIGRNYALNVSKAKYLFFSEFFELKEAASAENPFLLEIGLQPIPEPMAVEAARPIVLKNVFFASGSASLLPESIAELERLRALLLDNPTLRIQINGHTDSVGSDADNQVLSENRAKAVYTYLLENGIGEERLRFKGFGESKPLDTNDTEQGRQLNRRTEFVAF